MSPISFDLLTGRVSNHLVPCWSGALVHQAVLHPLNQLKSRAADAGFDLAVASSFRSFDRQLAIWQDKVSGRRPVLSANGEVVSIDQLSEEQLLWSILRWSALPGTSRHHWGTDIDVYDAAAVAKGYQLQLTADEYQNGGPFGAFSRWLSDAIAADNCCGFFRPYSIDRGGVAPELWHISYKPLAESYAENMNYQVFCQIMNSNCWPLNDVIRYHAKQIFRQFVESVPLRD